MYFHKKNLQNIWTNDYCIPIYGFTTVLTFFCSSPYDGKWSKSMVGYGAEDEHFVVELTYNYGLGAYVMGDDFCVSKTITSNNI